MYSCIVVSTDRIEKSGNRAKCHDGWFHDLFRVLVHYVLSFFRVQIIVCLNKIEFAVNSFANGIDKV